MVLGWLRRRRSTIRVHVLIRGRVGERWYDLDRWVRLESGATLGQLVERKSIPFGEVLAASPHLSETLLLNGERCPLAENRARPLGDGDRVYLLSPIVGG